MEHASHSQSVTLSWGRNDPEQRLAFRGGRFTRVNTLLAFLLGLALSIAFYVALIPFQQFYFAQTFTQRGPIPYSIVLFFFWSLAILFLKLLKYRLQSLALGCRIVPDDPEFVLSPHTVDEVFHAIYRTADDPRHFVLFNRIVIALSNLRNLGRVTDVDEILRSQAESDESGMETSYAILQGFVWAIPVLGFIGTVLGLSQAIGGFGSVLATSTDMSELKPALQSVTGGLAVAFETTLHGLLAALVIQLLLTMLKKSEEEFLDSCSEYCIRHIVGRLRVLPFEQIQE
jgi:biopolymer transport protein ExbB/TolQ